MNFRDWLHNESRFKGLQRMFVNQNPTMPRYVANQVYNNRVGSNFGKAFKTINVQGGTDKYQSPTIIGDTDTTVPALSPNSMVKNNAYIAGVEWQPKPVVINVGPLDFDERTLNTFNVWKFGFKPNDQQVKDDSKRFDQQRQIVAMKGDGDNEPIILIKEKNGKWSLLEGYHRTMLHLLSAHNPQIGAPDDQIEALKNGQPVDFSRWKPVAIKAYIGSRS